jgi:hypothetical protein
VYHNAPALAGQGERTVSSDELTGVQALERKLLRRGSFTSVADLESKVLTFIDYYNRTMARPFKWTYQGKALTV